MKYLIMFILTNFILMATTPDEINFEQIDDYYRAQISGEIKQLDYHKGKLYLSYADADTHYITAFYNDLTLEDYKSKYHKSYQYAPTLNFLISNDKKSYSVNAYKTESERDSHQHGYDHKSDDMVPIVHKIFRWEDDIIIYDNKYKFDVNTDIIMNTDYNYLYDKIISNYNRIKLDAGYWSGEYMSHTKTTEYIGVNSENNRYIFTEYFYVDKYYHNYNGSYESIDFCEIKSELKQNFVNSKKLCYYYVSYIDYIPTIIGKFIKYPMFSPDEKYFLGRIYSFPTAKKEYGIPTDTLVIYELPVTKEPTYVKFDSLSNLKCFSPNSNSLLMVINNQIYDFDLFTGKEISKMDFKFEHEIIKLDVSPENNTLAVVTNDWKTKTNNIYIFNYENYFSKIASVNDTEENEMIISPNPASDYIEISIPENHRVNPVVAPDEIAIYDVLGEKVLHSSTSVPSGHLRQRRTIRIDVANLPKGVYFVRVGAVVEKFVKY